MKPDTSNAYGTVSRFFHWVMAAGFLLMLFTAAAWTFNEDYFSLIDLHKSVGFVLMVLLLLRLVWTVKNLSRRPAGNLLVKLGHGVLYVLMAAVPLTAMLRQYGSARGGLKVFGAELMNGAPEKIEWMTRLGNEWHAPLAWTLFALAAGHAVMAVVHQLKGEKILNRMAGRN
ncbi:MAG: cytochrome b/b6 domain-containing protein [Eikenella sp.]|nr:cytochrome b/b6 domain-containing protein [Eikenella sp.]